MRFDDAMTIYNVPCDYSATYIEPPPFDLQLLCLQLLHTIFELTHTMGVQGVCFACNLVTQVM